MVVTPPAVATARAGGYVAVIQRASYGVPHITAPTFGSMGFGVGYVQAEDNLCVIAEKVVTADGKRSIHFGPTDANLRSDLFFEKVKGDQAALRPSERSREILRGFAAGYNHFLSKVGPNDPRCAGQPWVRPITEPDLWHTTFASLIRASSRALLDGIVAAAPPGAAAPLSAATIDIEALAGPDGSNAYGLGRGTTADGHGMVLANPHFPWDGAERFYRMHLRVPGRYDVEGVSLIGDPIVTIGHNATLAWSHTVSTARRFVWHRLTLKPGEPTTYLVDGVATPMKRRDVTVGSVTRTFYDTHFGPVVVVPGRFDWTATNAYAITDVNATNDRALEGWLRMGQARDVGQLREVLDRHQFLPWVNVIAADSAGRALYGDHSVVPRVTQELAAACIAPPFQPLYAATGQAVLDGSTSACALGRDADAAVPGILGPSRLPVLVRDDYVTNSNDSYWLSNPAQPLEGFSRIIGDERTTRSLRTRLGLEQVAGQRFTPETLWDTTFSNRVHGGELLRDDLAALCDKHPALKPACDALRGWDLRANLDSRGAHVFREFASAGGIRFADPFVVTDPVHTPRRLAVDDPQVLAALTVAVQRLSGITLDAPLGALQSEPRGSQRIPIHGGRHEEGTFNVITAGLVSGVGYPKIASGTSYVMAVRLGAHGPTGRQILTYSQSTNPTSPYYADQTILFSQKGFDTIKYTRAQLNVDPNLRTFVIHTGR